MDPLSGGASRCGQATLVGHPHRVRRVEQRAEIIIDADESQDIDLHFVTDLLGMQPTKLWRQGEPLPHTGRPRKRSAWIWETGDVPGYDSEAILCSVLDRFDAHTQTIRDLCRQHGLAVDVGLVVSMYGDVTADEDGAMGADVATPALHFSAATLRRLTALGASLDIDQYVIAPDDGGEPLSSELRAP